MFNEYKILSKTSLSVKEIIIIIIILLCLNPLALSVTTLKTLFFSSKICPQVHWQT